jgi:hypothetical protein
VRSRPVGWYAGRVDMIETFKIISAVVVLVFTLLGVIGGLLALPEKVKQFRRLHRPLADQGTTFYLLSRADTAEHTILEFLVAEDLMHFLSSWGKQGGGATTIGVEPVGKFFRVRMEYAAGTVDYYRKVEKDK